MPRLPQIPQDKANHFVYGAILALAAMALSSPEMAAAAVVIAAVGKELLDLAGHGTPEVLDAVATVAGGAVVLLPVLMR